MKVGSISAAPVRKMHATKFVTARNRQCGDAAVSWRTMRLQMVQAQPAWLRLGALTSQTPLLDAAGVVGAHELAQHSCDKIASVTERALRARHSRRTRAPSHTAGTSWRRSRQLAELAGLTIRAQGAWEP